LRVDWSPQALQRAAEIVDYIAADRPKVALEWLDGLESRLSALPGLPEQGRIVPEWYEPTVRELIYRRHRVIYEVHPDRVELLSIRHCREQIDDDR
jgi:plasmid stabilization system protein ParE